jgi:hypothetical protein
MTIPTLISLGILNGCLIGGAYYYGHGVGLREQRAPMTVHELNVLQGPCRNVSTVVTPAEPYNQSQQWATYVCEREHDAQVKTVMEISMRTFFVESLEVPE